MVYGITACNKRYTLRHLRPSTRRVGGLRSARSVATLAPTPHCATVCQPWPCSASPYTGWQTVVYNWERYMPFF